MSTTVNYDKYRDCDAAILEGFAVYTCGCVSVSETGTRL